MPVQVVSGASAVARGLATPAQLADIVNRAYTFAEATMWLTPHDRTSEAEVAARIERDGVLVALDGDRVVGSVFTEMLDSGRGWLGALGVDPEVDGRGAGAALLSACEDRARAAGADAMQLEVLVPHGGHPHTDRLWQWYHRRGFREVERGPLATHDPEIAVHFNGTCDLVFLRHSF